jgi:alanyl aminopeptidase
MLRILPTVFLATLIAGCNQQPEQTVAATATIEKPAGNYSDDGVPLGRLPRNVMPIHYRLQLEIVPERTTFSGHTEIDLDFREKSDHFFIHGEKLRVSESTLKLADGRSIDAGYEEYNETGIVRISLPEAVLGAATLVIDYDADFNESLEALYRVNSGGDYYAFTQFEAISARLAFPGFDEPSFKVPFDQVLIVDQAHETIAATPVVDTQLLDNGMKRVTFQTTKPLPTYLMVWAVGPLDIVEWADLPPTDVRDRAVPLRGVAARGKGKLMDYALENTEGIMTALESYFDIPYPYAKLDIIAVPDFDAGAMENPGAITYRETLLLFDDSASIRSLRRYAAVHAHELGHQWFGDLVTPIWWDDIWLNEAFATWVAAVGLEIWKPEGKWRRALGERVLKVMESDSLVNARQIRQPVLSNHGIAAAFDGITYSKGGGVIE